MAIFVAGGLLGNVFHSNDIFFGKRYREAILGLDVKQVIL